MAPAALSAPRSAISTARDKGRYRKKAISPSPAYRPNINCIAAVRVQPVHTDAKSGNAAASTPSAVTQEPTTL